MLPYIFRNKRYGGFSPNEIKDWSPTEVIDTRNFEIENIVASKGSSKAGTSIPSPLARMELFDTAFRIVSSDKANLKGKTIYHQLVSDCLDMLQLMFNIKNADIGIDKKLWFKEWKVRENIDKLKAKGTSHPNYLLGKSLDQIFSDRNNTRFAGVDSIFLIFYENKLLGGTSPLTLFFTSPNWARYVKTVRNVPQSSDGDVFFDDDFKALFERDEEFVEYVYKLFLQNKSAFENADGLRNYIIKTIKTPKFSDWNNRYEDYRVQPGKDSTVINKMDDDYNKVLTNVDNKYLTINGLYFYHQKEEKEREKIKKVSDFVIRASNTKYSVQKNEKGEEQIVYPPLVLVDGMNYSGDYMEKNLPWNSNTKILDRYHIGVPLFERKLPQGSAQSITYPFVTIDDFLEKFLVDMPFNINRGKFYSGFNGDFKYLLPIKKEYFNFFSLADLKNNLSITLDDSQIKVSLKVPVISRKGVPHILFSRTYSKIKSTVIECRADLGIYPFYQVTDGELNDYSVLLANRIEREPKNEELALHFFSFKNFASKDNQLENNPVVRSVFDSRSTATSKFYRLQTAFDFMELNYRFDTIGSEAIGLIVPDFSGRIFNKGNMIRAFTFAIDFGTSNTHIAWKENKVQDLPQPFETDAADQQMVLLNEPLTNAPDLSSKYASYGNFAAMDLILRREFVPAVITSENNADISFPFKTATCEIVDFSNKKSEADLFSHINIGYYIDKEENKGNAIYTTNLKWLLENNNDDSNMRRVRFFLQELFWQIKAKAIINNGNIADLKIVWSRPLSMESSNRALLKAILKEAFNAVFKSSGAVLEEPISESVAPYFYLTKSDTGIQNTANAINIDIGGGTTDVMMFMESAGAGRTDKYLTTSFRFAGNDLWGSGYKGKLKDNGFIRNYLIYQKASMINEKELIYITNGKEDGNLNADDLISMLFKYDNKLRFSDSVTIGNPNLSLVLYLHFSAIIYHIVQIVEAKNYPLPRYISFTGKGSQYIRMMCGGDETELETFTKLLISTYTDLPLQSSFQIHLNANPKEITANGSVLYSLSDDDEKLKYADSNVIEFKHTGFNPKISTGLAGRLISSTDSFLVADTLEVGSPLNVAVLTNMNLFLEKTLTSHSIIDFLDGFKVKNVKAAYNSLKWNGNIENGEGLVYDSYRKVLNNLWSLDKEKKLPESLFFFALKDALYQLSKQITDTKN